MSQAAYGTYDFQKLHSRKRFKEHYSLGELFPEERKLQDKFLLARDRVRQAFHEAYVTCQDGRKSGTSGFICYIGSTKKDLVEYVIDNHVGRPGRFVLWSEMALPRDVPTSYAKKTASRAEHELVARAVDDLHAAGLIYFLLDNGGRWEIAQSEIDDYLLNQQTAGLAHKTSQNARRESLHHGPLRVVH